MFRFKLWRGNVNRVAVRGLMCFTVNGGLLGFSCLTVGGLLVCDD